MSLVRDILALSSTAFVEAMSTSAFCLRVSWCDWREKRMPVEPQVICVTVAWEEGVDEREAEEEAEENG